MRKRLIAALLCACLLAAASGLGEGLLPTLTDTYGVPMPSLIEVLHRYPDAEDTDGTGAAVEDWQNVTEADFTAFGVLLKKQGLKLQSYTVNGDVFEGVVVKNGRSFTFLFDTAHSTARAVYPKGTYNERLFDVKSIWNAAEEAEKAGRYDEAAEKFAELIAYKDAAVPYRDADQCELRCYYEKGEARRTVQDWDGAVKAFEKAGSYSDAKTQITETRYQQAETLRVTGRYAEAYQVYLTVKGYKDVDNTLEDENLIAAAAAAAREAFRTVGGYVTFGNYEQDNNTGNGKEPIEWLVLDYDAANNRVLLISRYGLDARPYNKEYVNITWENCTLRTWLNKDFLDAAFSVQEQSAILTTTVDNGKSQGYSKWNTNGGNNTRDKIFLLSYAEANKYLGVTYENSNNMKSRTAPTAYAINNGAYTGSSYNTADGTAAGWWWLRSPGYNQNFAAFVNSDGSLHSRSVDRIDGCVRPAFWLNLDSGIF